MLDRVYDALRRGAHDEALTLARQFAADSPHDAQAHLALAQAARLSGDKATAQQAIARAVLLAPEDASMHMLRAGFLIEEQRLNEAQAALGRATTLDPNQFEAYLLQAQLAMGRGDLDETRRLQKLAARVDPEHPWTTMLAGLVATLEGDLESAQRLLIKALEGRPDDPQILHALGFVYLRRGHLAFAERCFRRVMEITPKMRNLRGLLADLMVRQRRFDEALEMLRPAVESTEDVNPTLVRMAGEIQLSQRRIEPAMALLRRALELDPADPRTLRAINEGWRRSGGLAEARATLDAVLERHPQVILLWKLRLSYELESVEAAQAVLDRWLAQQPELPAALESQMQLFDATGRHDEADALAERIVALEPGRTSAEMRLMDRALREDPERAIGRVDRLLGLAQTEEARVDLLQWLGYAQDRAGRHADAVATWKVRNGARAERQRPLPAFTAAGAPWPATAAPLSGTPPVVFLCGLPGSSVERVGALIAFAGYPIRADRIGERPPRDLLQRPETLPALAAGTLAAERLLGDWRSGLAERGVRNGAVIDLLPLWDNALLKMTRPLLPEALVMVAMRDPRDMLLEWLAFGAPQQFAAPEPDQAAEWMATGLGHLLTLREGRLQQFAFIRTDDALDDIDAFSRRIGQVLGSEKIAVPPLNGLGPRRFDAGHWRRYADILRGPFATLQSAATAFGYPAE